MICYNQESFVVLEIDLLFYSPAIIYNLSHIKRNFLVIVCDLKQKTQIYRSLFLYG